MIKIILLAYLLLINIITYFTYAADKTKARQNTWRIPERTLILLALLGGSPAALLAMKHYHHKTRHLKFKLGIPIILSIQIIITFFFTQIFKIFDSPAQSPYRRCASPLSKT